MSEYGFRALTFVDWATEDPSKIYHLDNTGSLKLVRSSDGSFQEYGVYTLNPISSGILGCHWHRIVIDADIPQNTSLEIKVYISDNPSHYYLPPKVHTFVGDVRDLLIQADPGKYIKLDIFFRGDGLGTPELRQVKIQYPRLSYLRYLPAVYQEDEGSRDFLERFLSVFESKLSLSEETISSLPVYFDPAAAPEGFLEWLASWLALDRYELLGEEKNREFIQRAVEFYRQKGTASGLAKLVSFLTGKECCVKEYMNNVFRSYGREHREAEVIKDAGQCQRFFHDRSETVDTVPQHGIISNMGKYADRVHYTYDSRANGRYSTHSIGLFIFRKPGETLQINEDELKKIINAFLPVFIYVDITIVES